MSYKRRFGYFLITLPPGCAEFAPPVSAAGCDFDDKERGDLYAACTLVAGFAILDWLVATGDSYRWPQSVALIIIVITIIIIIIVIVIVIAYLTFFKSIIQIESAYYLYKATKDNYYLEFGKKFLYNLQNNSRVNCGYASIADVSTGRLGKMQDSRSCNFNSFTDVNNKR